MPLFGPGPLASRQGELRRTEPAPRNERTGKREAVYARIANKMVLTQEMPPRDAMSPLPQQRYAWLATMRQEAEYLQSRELFGFESRLLARQRNEAINRLRASGEVRERAASRALLSPGLTDYIYLDRGETVDSHLARVR